MSNAATERKVVDEIQTKAAVLISACDAYVARAIRANFQKGVESKLIPLIGSVKNLLRYLAVRAGGNCQCHEKVRENLSS